MRRKPTRRPSLGHRMASRAGGTKALLSFTLKPEVGPIRCPRPPRLPPTATSPSKHAISSASRLVRLFKEGVLAQIVTDPAIRTLMELYDLKPPAGAGQVPDFITGFPPPPFPNDEDPSGCRSRTGYLWGTQRRSLPARSYTASSRIARSCSARSAARCSLSPPRVARCRIAGRRHPQRLYPDLPAPRRVLLMSAAASASAQAGVWPASL
jgi:hypothetical protein